MKNGSIVLKKEPALFQVKTTAKVEKKTSQISQNILAAGSSILLLVLLLILVSPLIILAIVTLFAAAYFGYQCWSIAKMDFNFDGKDLSLSEIIDELWN